ncbi:serine hydrolase domain-containing protein [Gluconobacter cerinus]|uniref:serine hydrolase domain-containing protein n=1 Tax=Gluconobacter cerinus TaxID=38307 RepID=UPI001B8BF417|nr:serine hydrolase domain-containing protein [Gluconobacter cerinus]MBS1023699.1 beta-lactamase family protein [Gluconobacter cerinus]MBS1043162.1 beta-lactamase family protein [Gluconobacter cerinus]
MLYSLTKERSSRRQFLIGGAALSCSALVGCASSSEGRFSKVDALARQAVKDKETPGVVLAVGHNGEIAHRYVYGSRALIPTREPMTWETRFDMASLTKPTMTALAVMQLVEHGKINIDDPVVRYLPEFSANKKSAVTLRLLLTHYSGLPPDVPLDSPWSGKAEAVRLAMTSPLANPPGAKFVYSDINYITLGLIVEKVTGQPLNQYVADNILTPLGMSHSGYLPDAALQPDIAPTQYDDQHHMLRGVVHDPTARRMGGVAGHAGLFSNAQDMCLYAQALLDRLAGRPSTFPLQRSTLELMTTPQQPAGKTDLRGLGWDIATHYSSPRGDLFSARSFGHTGFTGTSLWIDPESDSYVLILTNRVHPSGGHSVVKLRHDIATDAARALGVAAHP